MAATQQPPTRQSPLQAAKFAQEIKLAVFSTRNDPLASWDYFYIQIKGGRQKYVYINVM